MPSINSDPQGHATAVSSSSPLPQLLQRGHAFNVKSLIVPLKDRRCELLYQLPRAPTLSPRHIQHHVSVQALRGIQIKKLHPQTSTMTTRFRSSFRLLSRHAALRAQTLNRTVTLGARACLATSSPTNFAAAPHGEIEFTADKFPHMKRNSAFKKVSTRGVEYRALASVWGKITLNPSELIIRLPCHSSRTRTLPTFAPFSHPRA